MDFDEAPDHAAFRSRARAWLADHCEPMPPGPPTQFFASADEAQLEAARVLQKQMAAEGLAGLTWPEEHGGQGLSLLHQIIFDQEAAHFELPVSIFVLGLALAGPTIIAHGTEDQKARYLGPMLRGEEIWCQLFSEPDAGSDLASMRTRATRDGDEWVVRGQKVWSSGAHYADFGILLARTDPAQPKHRGITYFLVDMKAPGISVRPLRQMTGEAHFNEVFLEDVRIPAANVLGPVDAGWMVAKTTLMNERMMFAGGFTLDTGELFKVARAAVMDGRPANEHPVGRQALAEVYTQAQIITWTHARLVTALSQGRMPGPEGSLSKLVVTRLLRQAADLAVRLEGPQGTLVDDAAPLAGAWQKLFLVAPAFRILGGTDEIQRNIVGEWVLGLPKEPDPGRGRPFADQPSSPEV